MPQRDEISSKQNCIIALVIIVALIAIAAIVLPFVLDYPKKNGGSSGEPAPPTAPTQAPAPTEGSPSAPSAPTPPTISPAPTESPTTLRLGQFINQYLVPVSGADIFEDRNSPQFRAAEYIADVDPFTAELTSVEQLGDRYASITFYFATDGPSWTSCFLNDTDCTEGQWLVGDVCDWYRVSCNDAGRVQGYLFGTYLIPLSRNANDLNAFGFASSHTYISCCVL
jgi:hypothetical protein